MNSSRASLAVLLLLISLCASAREVTDTLYSTTNDRVIVTYSITQKGNKVDLQFQSVRKRLSDRHQSSYYKEIDKIQTFFFDRIGISKEMQFTGETPSAIVFPAKAKYKKSNYGYYIVEQKPVLSFELESEKATSFTVPIYLAHYEGKQQYKIFSSCGDLVIQLATGSHQSKDSGQSKGKTTNQQKNGEDDEEDDGTAELNDEALSLIGSIMSSLPRQDTLPMESTLERKVDNLVDLQSKIKDKHIARQIEETLTAYNDRKKELGKKIEGRAKQIAEDNAFTNCNTKEEFERYARQYPNGRHVDKAKEKIQEFDDKAKEEEKSKKKRTIWMIIGGALLAILLFVGNQALQSFRNMRTQRSIMQMQKEATSRAESKARSKVQGEISKQTKKVIGKARTSGQNIIHGKGETPKDPNGTNRVSI